MLVRCVAQEIRPADLEDLQRSRIRRIHWLSLRSGQQDKKHKTTSTSEASILLTGMAVSRTVLYGLVSTGVTTAVILNAFEERPNFFAATMYLSQSSASLMVLTNMFLVFTLMTGKVLQTVFFGRLRAIEVDHLYEKAWYAVTETCLAMTIFREEFDTRFFLFFTLLLAVKIFHWLAQDRVEYMEQTVEVSRSFHIRMVSIIGLLLALDTYLVRNCLEKVFAKGPNVMIMFAFEFTILASAMLAVAGKYALNLVEARQPDTWDNKSIYIFYLELITDFVRLVTYTAFFVTILTFYGLPLHIVRDLYVTLRSFTTKCRNFMRFRQATQDMDRRYPNASPAELEATGDKTCIVCREDMLHTSQPLPEGSPPLTPLDNPKKLPCGHILHFRCLRSWLERQQSCPMCRRPVLDERPTTTLPTVNAPNNANAEPQVFNPGANDQLGHNAPPGNLNVHSERDRNPPNLPSSTIQASHTRFQIPHAQASDAIQLPRDFRLPPGWALLPVTTTDPNAAASTSNQPGANVASGQNVIQQAVPGLRLPPMIPLFGQPQPTTVLNSAAIPSLSDDQIRQMESSTRRTVEERLRVLRECQNRINEGITMLTRLQTIPIVPEQSEPVHSESVPLTSSETETETTSKSTTSSTIPAESSAPLRRLRSHTSREGSGSDSSTTFNPAS